MRPFAPALLAALLPVAASAAPPPAEPVAFVVCAPGYPGSTAEAQVVAEGGRAEETWSLVAGKGRVSGPGTLDGWEILTSVGYAPRFVRGTALGGWGGAPPGAKVVAAGTVLSGLRRAAAGERVALLLDSVETAALPTLPFAKDLDVVTHSAAVPATVVCAVKKRASAAHVKEAVEALFDLRQRSSGAAALSAMRMDGFVPLGQESLRRARAAYAAAKDAP